MVFAGGGSGGHLYPGIAVAQSLQEVDPSVEVIFCCTTKSIDENILQGKNWDWFCQPVTPVPSRPWGLPRFYSCWRSSLRVCRNLIEDENVGLILGLGGYASGPALKVASQKQIPAAMLNPDALPGRANRYASKFCEKIFLQFPSTGDYFKAGPKKCLVTGCPIRKEILESSRSAASAKLRLDAQKQNLLIMGGSLGGRNLNYAVLSCLTNHISQDLLQNWQIFHITGNIDHHAIMSGYAKAGVLVQTFPYYEEMADLLAIADLAICRAGASTLAELTASGTPSILLPYPYHRDKHQLRNAEALSDQGAARIVIDAKNREITAGNLADDLQKSLSDPQLRKRMQDATKRLARPNASLQIAGELLKMV
jgi:UDP-N-acetylglucosamine--N-acetylmuramyl-(pentapeptide) pyrophosphoryl-undecaprenol N-acetylglucosamine transferase